MSRIQRNSRIKDKGHHFAWISSQVVVNHRLHVFFLQKNRFLQFLFKKKKEDKFEMNKIVFRNVRISNNSFELLVPLCYASEKHLKLICIDLDIKLLFKSLV